MTADKEVELEMLKNNLALGTCAEKPASKKQQALRRRRIKELEKANA